jgi:hypothetical protein
LAPSPNGEKWSTLLLQVRTWLSSSIDYTVMQEINARGKVIDFAVDFFEIKKHMKGEGPRAIKAAMNSFIKLSRTQFTTTEASILWVVDGPILNAYGIAGSNIPHA